MKRNAEVRKITFEPERIYSSIGLAIRRRGIPMELKGGDLLRGTVFGLVDHPEYTVEDAIKHAIEYEIEKCNFPGRIPETLEEGYMVIMECLDAVLRVEDFYDMPDGVDGDYSKYRMLDTKEIVDRSLKKITNDIWKDFCYTLAMKYLRKEGYSMDSKDTHILKDMVFKKLVATESTRECMYNFAYRKNFFASTCDKLEVEEIVDTEMKNIVPAGKDTYEFALEIVQKIYDEQKD